MKNIACMETNTQQNAKSTNENVIDVIRNLRNDLIKDFLDERYMREYFFSNFNTRELSNVKVEFIKKSLKELLITPVDIIHYQTLIDHIKTAGSATLTYDHERLLYKELELIFKKYAHLE
jgi:hypothetical protein